MPVSAQTPVNSSTGNGVTTVFPYTFKILAEADIEVTVDGVVKTLTTDYSVSGVGVDGGGNVTFVSAPANATTVVRRRDMAIERTTDYQENGDLLAATLDDDIDRVVMIVQQVDEASDRAISFPVGTTGVSNELPAPAANEYIGWNAGANALENKSLAGLGVVDENSIATKSAVQSQAHTAYTTGGSSTAFTLTPAPAIAANAENLEFDVEFHTAAGATPTLAVSGQTALAIKYRDASGSLQAITAKTTPSGWRSKVVHDGTQWIQREVPVIGTGYGQCRLTKSGANLILSPCDGNLLTINGVAYEIPDAGVTLGGSVAADGFYYIYAYMNAGTMTLEASTTARAASTTAGNKGTQIKSGDDSRSLVGAAYNQTDAWTDTFNSRLVLSWFNRRDITGRSWLTTNRTVAAVGPQEINTEARIYFLCWFDEAIHAHANGTASNSNAFQTTDMCIGLDGVAVIGGVSKQANTTATSLNSLAATTQAPAGQLAEAALHYVVLGGGASANTATYVGGADNAARCEVNFRTRG